MAAAPQLVLPAHPPPPGAPAATELTACDLWAWGRPTACAWGFPGQRFDAAMLRGALAAMLSDLPVLAGRMQLKPGLGPLLPPRMSSWHLAHTGGGATLTVAERRGATLAAAMGPGAWAWEEPRPAEADNLPFYFDSLDAGGIAMLAGAAPLLRVRLTQLADGDVLAITIAHIVADGPRLTMIARHLGARYRQLAEGRAPGEGELVASTGRCGVRLAAFCKEGKLGVPSLPLRPLKLLRLGAAAAAHWLRAPERRVMAVLHIPKGDVAHAKELASTGPGACADATSGDAVQAALMLLWRRAQGQPLLGGPQSQLSAGVFLQLPAPKDHFGNANTIVPVPLPRGAVAAAAAAGGEGEGAVTAALRAQAGAIREAVAAFRADPAPAVAAMEALAAAPLPAVLANSPVEGMSVAVNYVPWTQAVDLGLGTAAAFTQQLSRPQPAQWVVVRAAQPPYAPGGLFAQFCLPPAAAAAVKRLQEVSWLLPAANWL